MPDTQFDAFRHVRAWESGKQLDVRTLVNEHAIVTANKIAIYPNFANGGQSNRNARKKNFDRSGVSR